MFMCSLLMDVLHLIGCPAVGSVREEKSKEFCNTISHNNGFYLAFNEHVPLVLKILSYTITKYSLSSLFEDAQSP